MTLTIQSSDEHTTREFGRRLGERLFAGAVIGLAGPLGAGKTFLVRAISEGLGIHDSRVVSSPTFVLIQEYQARLPIYHFDTYRLGAGSVSDRSTSEEFSELGVAEYFAGDGVCLIEWADQVLDILPSHRLSILIEPTGPHSRTFRIEACGESYLEMLSALTTNNQPSTINH